MVYMYLLVFGYPICCVVVILSICTIFFPLFVFYSLSALYIFSIISLVFFFLNIIFQHAAAHISYAYYLNTFLAYEKKKIQEEKQSIFTN